jgi:hypothetical protein
VPASSFSPLFPSVSAACVYLSSMHTAQRLATLQLACRAALRALLHDTATAHDDSQSHAAHNADHTPLPTETSMRDACYLCGGAYHAKLCEESRGWVRFAGVARRQELSCVLALCVSETKRSSVPVVAFEIEPVLIKMIVFHREQLGRERSFRLVPGRSSLISPLATRCRPSNTLCLVSHEPASHQSSCRRACGHETLRTRARPSQVTHARALRAVRECGGETSCGERRTPRMKLV